MRITISVGWSQEINLPDLGSFEATCDISFESDHHLLETDPEGVLQYVKNALVVCRQSVDDELAIQARSGPSDDASNSAANQITPEQSGTNIYGSNGSESHGYRNGNGYSGTISTGL